MVSIAAMANDSENIENTIIRVARGDKQAYRQLVLQYADRVNAYCLQFSKEPYYAEELTQEIFIKLWTYRKQLARVDHWEGYLFTVAKHTAFRFMQRVSREEHLRQELLAHFSENTAQPDSQTEHLITVAHRAIQQLPPRRRQAFVMSRLNGMTHAEIADELGISSNTVKEHIVQATKAIKKYVKLRPDVAVLLLLFRTFN